MKRNTKKGEPALRVVTRDRPARDRERGEGHVRRPGAARSRFRLWSPRRERESMTFWGK